MRDAILATSSFATTPELFHDFVFTIVIICFKNSEGKRVFSTTDVREVMIEVVTFASTSDNARDFFLSMRHICADNPEGQRVFSTKEVRDAISKLANRFPEQSDTATKLLDMLI